MHKVKVLISNDEKNWPIERQSFQGKGKALNFHFSHDFENYDILLTDGNINLTNLILESRLPLNRKFCVLFENPRFSVPPIDYLSLHKFVICPFDLELPKDVIHIKTHAASPWFYDIDFATDQGLTHKIINSEKSKNLEKFCEMEIPKKTKLVSMITSTKGITDGHRLRIALANNLKQRLGNNIDLFGFGHFPITNKKIAIDTYNFSIAVENEFTEYYMTEKLTDILLGHTTPIYLGASKVNEYFNAKIKSVEITNRTVEQITNDVISLLNFSSSVSEIQSLKFDTLFKANYYYHFAKIFETYL